MDRMIKRHKKASNDLTYNGIHDRGVPPGSITEVISINALKQSEHLAKRDDEREHVTMFLKRNMNAFKIETYTVEPNIRKPNYQLSVDTAHDLDIVRRINDVIKADTQYVALKEIIKIIEADPVLLSEVTRIA